MITQSNIWGMLKDAAANNVIDVVDSGAPTNAVTGAGITGPGSTYTDYTNFKRYVNVGTLASPTWAMMLSAGAPGAGTITADLLASTVMVRLTGTIAPADIVGTGAGQLGHAAGVTILGAVGAHNVAELVSFILNYDFITAAYTGGGNITINNIASGAAITGLVSYANSVGAAADKSVLLVPLSAAATPLVENGGFSLVAAAAPTQPGTAAGVIRWVANYRIHATGF